MGFLYDHLGENERAEKMVQDLIEAAKKDEAKKKRKASPLLVIALCGKARSGKDTVAQALASHAGFFRVALADGLKSALNDLDGHTWEFRKERDELGKSDRWAAQQIGTECREAVGYPGHWVTHLLIKLHYANKIHPVPRHRFVIPDVRYPQEVARLRAFIEAQGGKLEVWCIERPGQDEISESSHPSERHISEIPVDCFIVNEGALADLYDLVKRSLATAEAGAEPASSLGGKAAEWTGEEVCCYQGGGLWYDVECSPHCFRHKDGSKPERPALRHKHPIPAIEDALNGDGPFPVLYLSGPMSGHRDLNFPTFNSAAEKLRRLGFPVLNPADFGQCASLEWGECLQRDLYILGCADVLVQLPGWEYSKGASLEYSTAVALGKGVASLDSLIR